MDSWNKGNELVVKAADQVVAKRVAGKVKPLDRVGSVGPAGCPTRVAASNPGCSSGMIY